MLTHVNGKQHRAPVPGIRLKPAHDREALVERFNPEAAKPISMAPAPQINALSNAPQPQNASQNAVSLPPGYKPALKIIKQHTRNGKIQFLVLFADKQQYWCDSDQCSELLVRHWRVKQAESRRRRLRRARKPKTRIAHAAALTSKEVRRNTRL